MAESSQTDRLRQLKNELNMIKNSNLTDSQFLLQSSSKFGGASKPQTEETITDSRHILTNTNLKPFTSKLTAQTSITNLQPISEVKYEKEKKKKLVEINSDSSSDHNEQSQINQKAQKIDNEQFVVDQVMKLFNREEVTGENEYIDKKLVMKQKQQKEQIKKHLRIMKKTMQRETEEQSANIEAIRGKLVQSQQRKDHTNQMLRELEQNQYQFEKDKIIMKTKKDSIEKEVQSLGFAQSKIQNKNKQIEQIMNMTIENQKELRERNGQLNQMLQMQQQAHHEKEIVMQSQLNELKLIYQQITE